MESSYAIPVKKSLEEAFAADMASANRCMREHAAYALKLASGTNCRERCQKCGRYFSRKPDSYRKYCESRACNKSVAIFVY